MSTYAERGIMLATTPWTDLAAAARVPCAWMTVRGCWWTHDPTDLYAYTERLGHPVNPHGQPVAKIPNPSRLIVEALANPAQFGRWGLAAFIAAHAGNTVTTNGLDTLLASWRHYGELLDENPERAELFTIPKNVAEVTLVALEIRDRLLQQLDTDRVSPEELDRLIDLELRRRRE